MLKYIGKRFFVSLLTILVVISVTFFLMRLMPGGPFDGDKLTPQARANMAAKYGTDKPLFDQYTMYLKNLVQGDLGESMVFEGRKVSETIATSFPASAKLGIVAVIIAIVGGVLLGTLAALKNGKWPDRVVVFFATLCITIPSFVIGAVLIYVFGVYLEWLPPTGFGKPENYIMPCIALSAASLSFITRLTRSKLIDVLKADYIRTAKAKGLSKGTIIFKHALRNSLIPIVTYVGPLVASILTGGFVTEKIFAIPGLGNEFVQSVTNRDYTMLLGVTVFYCTMLIFFTFLVDILYVLIDPRIKLQDAEV